MQNSPLRARCCSNIAAFLWWRFNPCVTAAYSRVRLDVDLLELFHVERSKQVNLDSAPAWHWKLLTRDLAGGKHPIGVFHVEQFGNW
jgi:hypothetical protein